MKTEEKKNWLQIFKRNKEIYIDYFSDPKIDSFIKNTVSLLNMNTL